MLQPVWTKRNFGGKMEGTNAASFFMLPSGQALISYLLARQFEVEDPSLIAKTSGVFAMTLPWMIAVGVAGSKTLYPDEVTHLWGASFGVGLNIALAYLVGRCFQANSKTKQFSPIKTFAIIGTSLILTMELNRWAFPKERQPTGF